MQRQAISDLRGFAAAVFGLARTRRRAAASWPIVIGAALSLASCGSTPGSFDVTADPQTKLNNLAALVQFKKMPKQPEPTDHVVCPDIAILDGTADDRAYGPGEQTNANVRYQFSLNDVARDCKTGGGQMNLKVGVAGKVLLGPVGAPGAFTAPIRIAIIRKIDQEPIVSKLYRLPVTVPTGQSEAPFTLVTEPLSIPYTHGNEQHDYAIKVGFDAAGNDKRTKAMVDAAASARVRPDAKPSSDKAPRHRHHRQADPSNPSTD